VDASAPTLFGVKVNVTLQEAPLATTPLQSSVAVKSVASVSVPVLSVMALAVVFAIVDTAVDDLAPTTVALNDCEIGVIVRLPLPVPTPESDTVWVEVAALSELSVTARAPVLAPLTVGLKSRAKTQLDPAAKE